MKVWTGSAWSGEKPVKVWNGSAWVAKPLKYWDGTKWMVKPNATRPTTFNLATTAADITLSNGNLTAAKSANQTNYSSALSSLSMGARKLYFEVTITFMNNIGNPGPGLALTSLPLMGPYLGGTDDSLGWYAEFGIYCGNDIILDPSPIFRTDDIVGMALDRDAKILSVRNISRGDAWATADVSRLLLSGEELTVAVALYEINDTLTVNFDGAFVGSPPSSGYVSWGSPP